KPGRWKSFTTKYRAELAMHADLLDLVEDLARRSGVTLLYSARDAAHNNAVVLRDFLDERRRGGRGRAPGKPGKLTRAAEATGGRAPSRGSSSQLFRRQSYVTHREAHKDRALPPRHRRRREVSLPVRVVEEPAVLRRLAQAYRHGGAWKTLLVRRGRRTARGQ